MTGFALDQVDRLLTTTKAVRRQLDLSHPVDREVVAECAALASYAPNRSNYQSWR
jgi:nitroreductase